MVTTIHAIHHGNYTGMYCAVYTLPPDFYCFQLLSSSIAIDESISANATLSLGLERSDSTELINAGAHPSVPSLCGPESSGGVYSHTKYTYSEMPTSLDLSTPSFNICEGNSGISILHNVAIIFPCSKSHLDVCTISQGVKLCI